MHSDTKISRLPVYHIDIHLMSKLLSRCSVYPIDIHFYK